MNISIRSFLHGAKLAGAIGLTMIAACSKPPGSVDAADAPDAGERTYEVRGIVREAPDFAARSVMIEHEDIPGFMPAMTMPFDFRDVKEVESLRVGDAVAFQLAVTDKDSWIRGVRPVPAESVKLPQPKASAPVAGKVERVKEGQRMPEFELVDQAGRPLNSQTFEGKSLLLTFIFTRCPIPNYCPLMAQNFHTIHAAIRADAALAGKVNLLSISFDEFDTPAVLADYGAKLSEDLDAWRFATGRPEEVRKLTQAFAVQVQPESGTINHGLATVLVAPDGVIRNIWRGNGWKTDEVLEALRRP